ncbi:MAG: 30S ribosomal protein S16 [Patescibacteria group bacterium]
MRLQRIGKKGQAYFRLILTEHTKKPQGEYLELLGSYDPHKKNLLAKKERIEHWMSKGVQFSPTLNNLLINNKVISADKMLSWKPKVKDRPVATPEAPKAKAEESTAPEAEAPATEATPEPASEAPAETPAE